MADRLDPLQSKVEELARHLNRLEARVSELERVRSGVPAVPRPGPREAGEAPRPEVALPRGTVALMGRSLLVLAGAYLVRAMTDGRVVPAAVGVTLGLAYAAFWQLRADREAQAGRRESAFFHDLASSLIAFPLIWEATARFGLLGPRAACAALVAFFALGLGVAWHRRLVVNAGLTTALSLATAVALLVSAHDLLAVFAALLAMAAGLEWLAYRDTWLGLRWWAALVLDGVAFLLVAVMTRPEMPEGYAPLAAPVAALLLVALPALYVAGLAARTLRRERPVTAFEVAQGAVAALLGFGGAWTVLDAHRLSAAGPGILALVLGGLCYAAAFAFAERREGQGRNFYFYSTAGGLLILAGTQVLSLGSALAFAWGGLGLAAAFLGRRFGRMTLRVHGVLYLAAAAAATGLVIGSLRVLAGPEPDPLPPLAWVAALAAGAGYVVLATDPGAGRSGWARVPPFLAAVLAACGVAAAAETGLLAALGRLAVQDAGVAATARTAVLAGLALALAWAAQRASLPELGWLVYPLLAAGGLKLLLEDLRQGRPATLVASLALYGAVLVLAPRWLRPGEDRAH